MRIRAVVSLICLFFVPGAAAKDCQMEAYKGDIDRSRKNVIVYTGRVKPGSADIIYIELWRNREMIGQTVTHVNPRGVFKARLIAEKKIRRSSRVVFSCR